MIRITAEKSSEKEKSIFISLSQNKKKREKKQSVEINDLHKKGDQ